MESLREAALALRKSPQSVRKKLTKITGKFDRMFVLIPMFIHNLLLTNSNSYVVKKWIYFF